ncbi:MAG: hypothetical protein V4671_11310 [Armatimonadota bacterium]
MPAVRTCVTFHCPHFNITVDEPYFINPGNFGDDLLRALLPGLSARGLEIIGDPFQEDYGWVQAFLRDERNYHLAAGFRPEDRQWLIWVEPEKRTAPEVPWILHAVLLDLPGVRDIRWHHQEDFDAGNEDAGAAEPSSLG